MTAPGDTPAVTDDGYAVNVDGVVTRGEEYLLVERAADEDHAPGVLGLPGGTLEAPPGTDGALAAAARRELAEEVGVEVGAVEYVCSGVFATDTGQQCLNVVTRCEQAGGAATARATDEVAGVHWLATAELRDHPDVPAFTETYVEAPRRPARGSDPGAAAQSRSRSASTAASRSRATQPPHSAKPVEPTSSGSAMPGGNQGNSAHHAQATACATARRTNTSPRSGRPAA